MYKSIVDVVFNVIVIRGGFKSNHLKKGKFECGLNPKQTVQA